MEHFTEIHISTGKKCHPSKTLYFYIIIKGCNCIIGDNLIQMFYLASEGKLENEVDWISDSNF